MSFLFFSVFFFFIFSIFLRKHTHTTHTHSLYLWETMQYAIGGATSYTFWYVGIKPSVWCCCFCWIVSWSLHRQFFYLSLGFLLFSVAPGCFVHANNRRRKHHQFPVRQVLAAAFSSWWWAYYYTTTTLALPSVLRACHKRRILWAWASCELLQDEQTTLAEHHSSAPPAILLCHIIIIIIVIIKQL